MTNNSKSLVEESANYDNYMDDEARKNDSYSISLDKFFDEPIPDKLVDATRGGLHRLIVYSPTRKIRQT